MIQRLVCRLIGHDAHLVPGTFYVFCDRCGAALNLRIETAIHHAYVTGVDIFRAITEPRR